MARAKAYLHAKFHLDPSNRLATVHERYRQTDRQTDNNGLIAYGKPFYKRSPKNVLTTKNFSVTRPWFALVDSSYRPDGDETVSFLYLTSGQSNLV